MGRVEKTSTGSQRHDPLGVQLRTDTSGLLSAPGRRANKKHRKAAQDEDGHIDAKSSSRILELAKQQQEEELNNGSSPSKSSADAIAGPSNASFLAAGNPQGLAELEDDEENEEEYNDDEDFGDEEYEEIEIDENDQAILESFMPNAGGTANLADLIMAKIQEREAKDKSAADVPEVSRNTGLDPKVVEVYTRVGQLLSRYKSGPLPKAFKILPTLAQWPLLLSITSPDTWTPHALLAATRIFASNLDPKQSQRFYRDILSDRIREEIMVNKKLSVQSYFALKKALYKPAAFFKGLLFPLCESGTCTLREAVIIGSILSKVSIPVLHSGAALLKLADMDYSGPNSLFIRVLLDKKYALPYKVVDALVFHFLRFKRDRRELPVLWHQAFLVFAQRYKSDLTPEQKEALIDVLKAKSHPQITPEIRRELIHSTARGEQLEEPAMEAEEELGMEL